MAAPRYEYQRLRPLESRDRRVGGLQEIVRSGGRSDLRRADDEGCARSIVCLNLHEKREVELLEAAQDAIKRHKPFPRLKDLHAIESKLYLALKRLSQQRYTARTFCFCFRCGARMRTWDVFEHEEVEFVGRSLGLESFFLFGTTTQLDRNLQQRHFILACLTICHRLRWRQQYSYNQHLKDYRHLMLGQQILSRTVHEYLQQRSLIAMNLLGDVEGPLHLSQVRSAILDIGQDGAMHHATIDITSEVKSIWMDRMYESRRTAAALEVIWKKVTCLDTKGEALYYFRAPHHRRQSKSEEVLGIPKPQAMRRYSFDNREAWYPNLALDGWERFGERPAQSPHVSPISTATATLHWDKSYMVVGWFPTDLMEPVEVCMWYFEERRFLSELKRQIGMLRGWRRIFSLKTVQEFGLYKCDLAHRAHSPYMCSPAEKAILAQFYRACYRKSLSVDQYESVEWGGWVQANLNNNSDCLNGRLLSLPFQCHLSLMLIVRWSQTRLITAASIPVLLSLGIGTYYTLVYHDPQTAWTISSYVVTTGAFIIALLAVLSSLKDG